MTAVAAAVGTLSFRIPGLLGTPERVHTRSFDVVEEHRNSGTAQAVATLLPKFGLLFLRNHSA
jgi:hypothetical protein